MPADIDMPREQLQMELDNLVKAVGVINHLALSLDTDDALRSVTEAALELLECERVTLFLVFDQQKELRARGQNGAGESILIKVKFGEGIAGMVAATGQLLNVADAYLHPAFNGMVDKSSGYQTRTLLCCAIRDITGRNVAVLQALNKRGNRVFSTSDERSLSLFGTHLGNSLAKARLHEQAERERQRLSVLFNSFKLLSTATDLFHVSQTLWQCTELRVADHRTAAGEPIHLCLPAAVGARHLVAAPYSACRACVRVPHGHPSK